MSVQCSSHNLSQLDKLNQELSFHCYALELVLNEAPTHWSEHWQDLMYERVCFFRADLLGPANVYIRPPSGSGL